MLQKCVKLMHFKDLDLIFEPAVHFGKEIGRVILSFPIHCLNPFVT